MNRAIEQTLLSLLPAQNDNLPPQLVSLASSLLAQSRNRASTLKAEEEIARAYACSHVACDRLKIALNLPQIQPRPPIAPRIYKRLYNYLDTILPNNTSGAGTPRSAARVRAAAAASGTPASQQARTPSRGAGRFRDLAASPSSTGRVPGSQRPTPSQAESLARFRSSPTKTLWRRGAHAHHSTSKQPPWLRTVARHLCTAMDVAHLAPFVFAGLDHVLLPPGGGPPDPWAVENPAGLLAALVFFCMRALARANAAAVGDDGAGGEDEELDGEQYKALEKSLLKVWNRAREELPPGKEAAELTHAPGAADAENADAAGGGADDHMWKGWRTLKPKDLKEALVVVTDKNWLDSDWFRGIQDLSHEGQGADGDDGEHEQGGPVAQLWRADTMLQERWEPSERRRRDYAVWKTEVLQHIGDLEQKGAVLMDVCP
ncbi:hypothetical protein RB594_007815 [Gaeumannomyces avenae]